MAYGDYYTENGCLDLAKQFPALHEYIMLNCRGMEEYKEYIRKHFSAELISIYDMLGATGDSELDVLRQRYRSLSKKLHPNNMDKTLGEGEAFVNLNDLCELIGCGNQKNEEYKRQYDEWLATNNEIETEKRDSEICFEGPKGVDRTINYSGSSISYPDYMGNYIYEAYEHCVQILLGDIRLNSRIYASDKLTPDTINDDYELLDLLDTNNLRKGKIIEALIYTNGYVGEIVSKPDEISETGRRGAESGWREELRTAPYVPTKYIEALTRELLRRATEQIDKVILPFGNTYGKRRIGMIGSAEVGTNRFPLWRLAEVDKGEIKSGALLILDLEEIVDYDNPLERSFLDNFLYENLSPDGLENLKDRQIGNGVYFLGRPIMDDDYKISFSDMTEKERQIIEESRQTQVGRNMEDE